MVSLQQTETNLRPSENRKLKRKDCFVPTDLFFSEPGFLFVLIGAERREGREQKGTSLAGRRFQYVCLHDLFCFSLQHNSLVFSFCIVLDIQRSRPLCYPSRKRLEQKKSATGKKKRREIEKRVGGCGGPGKVRTK